MKRILLLIIVLFFNYFATFSQEAMSKNKVENSQYVPHFDWRTRHGATNPESPYYSGRPEDGWFNAPQWQSNTMLCASYAACRFIEAYIRLWRNQSTYPIELDEQGIESPEHHLCSPILAHFSMSWQVPPPNTPIQNHDYRDNIILSNWQRHVEIISGTNHHYEYYGFKPPWDSTVVDDLKNILIKYGPFVMGKTAGISGHALVLVGYITDQTGQTVWIFSNSGGETTPAYYEYMPITEFKKYSWDCYYLPQLEAYYGVEDSETPPENGDEIKTYFNIVRHQQLCRDYDNDGYFNWGLGPKPENCPNCPDEEDGDDSNPLLGPIDEYGNYICEEIKTITETIDNATLQFRANQTVIATNVITNNSNVLYGANTSVSLQNGFKVEKGTSFKAIRQGCLTEDNNSYYNAEISRYDDVINKDTYLSIDTITLKQNNPFKIYPQPSEGIFNIDLTEKAKIHSIEIKNQIGNSVLIDKNPNIFNNYNLSSFGKGLYLIYLYFENQTYVEKLVVN